VLSLKFIGSPKFPDWELWLDHPYRLLQSAMRVISRKTLKDFWAKHADAEQPLKSWFQEANAAQWRRLQDIKNHYVSADALPGHRVVFNLKGNTYRLVVKIHYNTGIVYIRFIGTHAAYDKINATTI
jgi:mRNA interferase HigB